MVQGRRRPAREEAGGHHGLRRTHDGDERDLQGPRSPEVAARRPRAVQRLVVGSCRCQSELQLACRRIQRPDGQVQLALRQLRRASEGRGYTAPSRVQVVHNPVTKEGRNADEEDTRSSRLDCRARFFYRMRPTTTNRKSAGVSVGREESNSSSSSQPRRPHDGTAEYPRTAPRGQQARFGEAPLRHLRLQRAGHHLLDCARQGDEWRETLDSYKDHCFERHGWTFRRGDRFTTNGHGRSSSRRRHLWLVLGVSLLVGHEGCISPALRLRWPDRSRLQSTPRGQGDHHQHGARPEARGTEVTRATARSPVPCGNSYQRIQPARHFLFLKYQRTNLCENKFFQLFFICICFCNYRREFSQARVRPNFSPPTPPSGPTARTS